jgi:hypothetical protein
MTDYWLEMINALDIACTHIGTCIVVQKILFVMYTGFSCRSSSWIQFVHDLQSYIALVFIKHGT